MAATSPRPCCVRVGLLDLAARVCPECGTPIIRCRGYGECRQVLGPGDHCPIHVAPRLTVLGRNPPKVPAGGTLSLPLLVHNASGCGAELRLRRIFAQSPGRDLVAVPPDWDRLRAGEEKPLAVDTGRLDTPGRPLFRLYLVLSSAPGGVEEAYAFFADMQIVVEEREGPVHVEQAGGDVIVMGGRRGGWTDAAGFTPAPVRAERAEAFELRAGLRGYSDPGFRIPRSVRLSFTGFPAGDVPPPGRPFLEKAELRFGRNSRACEDPSDASLRAYGTGGELNRTLSSEISALHFAVRLADDRLTLWPHGRNGTFRNGQRADTAVLLSPLDRIRVLAPERAGPEMEVRMQVENGFATEIVFAKVAATGGR